MPQIRQISAQCSQVDHISSFTVTMMIGQYPTYTVVGQLGDFAAKARGGEAVSVSESLAGHATKAAELQQEILNGGGSDNFELTIDGGGGVGSQTFVGVLASAEVNAGKSQHGIEIHAKGTDVVLDYFDSAPYKIKEREVHRETTSGGPSGFAGIVGKAVEDLKASVVEGQEALAAANEAALDRFMEIIENSQLSEEMESAFEDGTYPGWVALYQFALRLLSASSETGLMSTLQALGESVGAVYVPEADRPGSLVSWSVLVREAPKRAGYPGCEQVSSAFSRRTRIPMQRVSIEGAYISAHRGLTRDRASTPIVASYSEGGGLFGMSIPVPAWHRSGLILPHVGVGGAAHNDGEIGTQSQNNEETAQTVTEAAQSVLTALAKSHFDHLQKAAFTITLQECPLSPRLDPGSEMEVPQFGKGLVNTVQHSLALEEDSATLATTVVLTHMDLGS